MILQSRYIRLFLILFVVLYAIVLVRNAWLCDDSYIFFRTVDNLINGYGLTWNTIERVQHYSCPLWILLLSVFYYFTREIYYTSLLLSIAVSLAAIYVLAFKIARTSLVAIVGITILIFSKAFMDYSTSGLENPLTNLLLAIFFFIVLTSEMNRKVLFLLSLVAALGTFNRMDTGLIYLPFLVYGFLKVRTLKGFYTILLGFLPLILWECFALFYYGFLLSNTGNAKIINNYMTVYEMIKQGSYYFLYTIKMDPLTLLVIVIGSVVPFLEREWRKIPVVIGIILYLLYTLAIGGCYMSGRFFSGPLLCAVILIISSRLAYRKIVCLLTLGGVIVVGFGSAQPPILSNADFGIPWEGYQAPAYQYGVINERQLYYRSTGLLRPFADLLKHPWVKKGLQHKADAPCVVIEDTIGMMGYYAGPHVHIVDDFALTDAFLARLPGKGTIGEFGHFERKIPAGYVETLKTGRNMFKDKNLGEFYEKLSYVIRGDLRDMKRLGAIWNMNVGKYNHLIAGY